MFEILRHFAYNNPITCLGMVMFCFGLSPMFLLGILLADEEYTKYVMSLLCALGVSAGVILTVSGAAGVAGARSREVENIKTICTAAQLRDNETTNCK